MLCALAALLTRAQWSWFLECLWLTHVVIVRPVTEVHRHRFLNSSNTFLACLFWLVSCPKHPVFPITGDFMVVHFRGFFLGAYGSLKNFSWNNFAQVIFHFIPAEWLRFYPWWFGLNQMTFRNCQHSQSWSIWKLKGLQRYKIVFIKA